MKLRYALVIAAISALTACSGGSKATPTTVTVECSVAADAVCVGANLAGKDMSGLNLTGIDLRNANLDGAIFTDTNLTQANLVGASLAGANLVGSTLVRANFSQANLEKADFTRALLSGAILKLARIESTVFNAAFLTDANFAGAMGSTDISQGHLCKTVLPDAKIGAPSC